jgi:glycerol-3-phosphate acyltransferase PlsX
VAAGAALAAKAGVRVLLFGPASELGDPPPGVQITDAPVSIAKSPDPATAVRNTPDASIVMAARAVASGQAQALVCAGGTGAALAAGLFNIKRALGIYRPALALTLPAPNGPVTLLDVGANTECRREHLVQFAFMGAALVAVTLGLERPRVGLLSNGSEIQRGNPTVIATNAELLERSGEAFQFVGNVEGDTVLSGQADVIVTDGFTGNIALKLIEGTSQTVLGAVRDAAMSSQRSKLGGLLLKPSLLAFRERIDPEAQGGAYLLGLRNLGVVAHGRFTRAGFAQAILRAHAGAHGQLISKTHATLLTACALRSAPASGQTASLPPH